MPYVDIGFTGLFFVSTWYHNILKPLTRIKIQICLAFRIHSPKELEEMYCMKSLTTTLILVKNQWLEINQWWYYKSDLTVNQNLIFFQSVLLNLRGPVERISQKKAEFHSLITRHRTICCPKNIQVFPFMINISMQTVSGSIIGKEDFIILRSVTKGIIWCAIFFQSTDEVKRLLPRQQQ